MLDAAMPPSGEMRRPVRAHSNCWYHVTDETANAIAVGESRPGQAARAASRSQSRQRGSRCLVRSSVTTIDKSAETVWTIKNSGFWM
jgi:hypothetical protein